MSQQETEQRRPYEAPAIKFEKKIETFATACTCNDSQKSTGVVLFTPATPSSVCAAVGFS